MGKRNKDLFYLLEEREQGVRGGAKQEGARPAAEVPSLLAAVKQLFTGAPPGTGTRRRPAAPPALPGILVAAVALVCLGVGFGLGRWLPRAEAASQGLTARGDTHPQRPGPLQEDQARPPGHLPPEKEQEVLSTVFLPLLMFSAPQAEEAARLAAYLRAQGVETARIRKLQTKADKSDVWVVLAYTTRVDVTGTLAKLKAVAPSRAWPRLAPLLQQLGPADLRELEPAGG